MSKYCIVKEENPYQCFIVLDLNNPFTLKPHIKSSDRISVSKVDILDEDIINSVVRRRLKKQLSKLVTKTMVVLETEDDEEDGTNLKEALNEAAKFHNMLASKYRRFLKQEYEREQRAKLATIVEELKKKRTRTNKESSLNTSNKGR